jgi:hypothetical protein
MLLPIYTVARAGTTTRKYAAEAVSWFWRWRLGRVPSSGIWRRVVWWNTMMNFMDVMHRPSSLLETTFRWLDCLLSQVKRNATQLGPTDRASYLRSPAPTQREYVHQTQHKPSARAKIERHIRRQTRDLAHVAVHSLALCHFMFRYYGFKSHSGHGCLMCVCVFLCLCCPVFR